MYQEAAKNIKAYKPHCFACIFLFLSCIPIKKYGVVSLGMGFDGLTACSWCGGLSGLSEKSSSSKIFLIVLMIFISS